MLIPGGTRDSRHVSLDDADRGFVTSWWAVGRGEVVGFEEFAGVLGARRLRACLHVSSGDGWWKVAKFHATPDGFVKEIATAITAASMLEHLGFILKFTTPKMLLILRPQSMDSDGSISQWGLDMMGSHDYRLWPREWQLVCTCQVF